MLTLYRRFKDSNDKWKAEKVREGRGIRTSAITGTFFVRPWINGVQKRTPLHSTTFNEARAEAAELEKLCEAQSKGLTVHELSAAENAHRIPVKRVIATYLEQKATKSKKTQQQYRLALYEFMESLAAQKIRFLDEINESVIRKYKDFLAGKEFAGKTIDTRINIVYFMLKKNDVVARLPKDEMPIIEEEPAVPYGEEELKKLFAAMTDEERLRYRFFLGTACREREVQFASWADIDWTRKEFHVRSKPEVGFTVKNHESRSVPMPDSLVAALKERKRNPPHVRWIFVNRDGNPDGHFLKKLKRIALHAKLNCGHCRTEVTKGKYDQKEKVVVTCSTDPVCSHIKLHRLRKTCATRWQDHNVSIRTIQTWLGHKNLETTMIYLGVTDSGKLRSNINAAFGD